MPKVRFHRFIESITGQIGDLVFYQADGDNLSRRAPEITAERTAKQIATSDRFTAAGAYAKTVTADPVMKAAYKALCRGHQNARNLAIRDWLTPPVIHAIKLEGYTGKPGQVARVKATDDFRVKEVKLAIRDPQGNLIEEGAAQLAPEADEWCYTTQAEVAAGQTVSVTAVAEDFPGNKVQLQCWHFLFGAPNPVSAS